MLVVTPSNRTRTGDYFCINGLISFADGLLTSLYMVINLYRTNLTSSKLRTKCNWLKGFSQVLPTKNFAKPRRKYLRNHSATVSSSSISGQPIEITLIVIGSANHGTHKSSPIQRFRHGVGNTGFSLYS